MRVPVALNALPWARVTIRGLDGAELTDVPQGLVTPCVVLLPTGRYEVLLENGGVTSELRRAIEVGASDSHELTFVMPAFEPRSAAQQAVARLVR